MNELCKDVSLYFYGELDAQRAASFEKHLSSCPQCRKDLAFLRQVQTALLPSAAPEKAVERVLRRPAVGWWRRMWKPVFSACCAVFLVCVFWASVSSQRGLTDERVEWVAYVSAEADAEFNSFAADLAVFEEEF